MKAAGVRVYASGAIALGPDVCCDGFHRDYGARVQTHVHIDHMHNFETSKGNQDIYVTPPTRALLIAEFNADLSSRDNVIALPTGETCLVGSSIVRLLSTDHMLGAAQVCVELPDGVRAGYSGDFQWPLNEVISVDVLVLDSTYGSPMSVRRYTQEDAETALLSLAAERLTSGPLLIKAHRGTIHRGLEVLSELASCPMMASRQMCAEIDVYRAHGYPIGEVLSEGTEAADDAIESGRYIRFYGKGDRFPVDPKRGTTIILSGFMTQPDDPVLEFSPRAVRVAMTDHADFDGTLAYVRASGAKLVITDNSRGGHAVELAREIKSRLGIEARPSELVVSHEWGV
jgi:putative mRNA 3-end processing factor